MGFAFYEQYSLAKNRHKLRVSLNVHGKYNLLKFLIMKNLKNLGKALSKAEQKSIQGGKTDPNPPEYCHCYNVTYLVDGEITTTYPTSGPVIPVGWTPVSIPLPDCCN